jgi:hypothetical protein
VLTLAVSMSIVWLLFILNGFPWTGLLGVSLALALLAASWVAADSTRSIADLIDDIEAEPVPAIATRVKNSLP